MPIFKGRGCTATPNKAIKYITRKDKAEIISSSGLDDKRDYAKQFRETAALFNKGDQYKERKYYHFKLSCDKADNVPPKESHALAEKTAAELFQGHEYLIATHTDTGTIHSHIIVNAVSFEDGKKLHYSRAEYVAYNIRANEIAASRGYSTVRYKEVSKRKNFTNAERHQKTRLGSEQFAKENKKDDIRQLIDEAREKSKTFEQFKKELKNRDIEIVRQTEKTITYQKGDFKVRGSKLGERFDMQLIKTYFRERNRTVSL